MLQLLNLLLSKHVGPIKTVTLVSKTLSLPMGVCLQDVALRDVVKSLLSQFSVNHHPPHERFLLYILSVFKNSVGHPYIVVVRKSNYLYDRVR